MVNVSAINVTLDVEQFAAEIGDLNAIVKERIRQMHNKGYTPEHDDEHVNDEIAALAAWYAMPPTVREWDASSTCYGDTLGEAILPSNWAEPEKFKGRYRELTKAAALILAEMGRIRRAGET